MRNYVWQFLFVSYGELFWRWLTSTVPRLFVCPKRCSRPVKGFYVQMLGRLAGTIYCQIIFIIILSYTKSILQWSALMFTTDFSLFALSFCSVLSLLFRHDLKTHSLFRTCILVYWILKGCIIWISPTDVLFLVPFPSSSCQTDNLPWHLLFFKYHWNKFVNHRMHSFRNFPF